MSEASGILLRVFSGPHLGAELPLSAGSWVVGASDACDLIFYDAAMAPKHAELEVRDGRGGAELYCRSMEGGVITGGKAVREGALKAEFPFIIGETIFAWLPLAEAVSAGPRWQKVAAGLSPPKTALDSEQTEQAAQGMGSGAHPAPSNMVGTSTKGGNNVGSQSLKSGPFGIIRLMPKAGSPFLRLGFLLAMLALCSVTLVYYSGSSSPQERVNGLNELLAGNGFGKLRAHETRQGIAVGGEIVNDEERGRLLALVQRLHYPVYLEVNVRSDRARAIEDGFNSLGLYLEVRESSHNDIGTLTISGYIKDEIIEERAFSGLRKDLPPTVMPGPDSANLRLERRIFHADDIAGKLAPELAREELDFADIVYLPGKILISGGFSLEQRSRLASLLAGLQREIGVTIPIEVWNSPNRPAQASVPQKPGKPPLQEKQASLARPAGPGGFTVVGVTMKPMRFVSLKSGEKVFEGGLLPGGWVVESIGINELQLQKDGHTTTYKLRGAQ